MPCPLPWIVLTVGTLLAPAHSKSEVAVKFDEYMLNVLSKQFSADQRDIDSFSSSSHEVPSTPRPPNLWDNIIACVAYLQLYNNQLDMKIIPDYAFKRKFCTDWLKAYKWHQEFPLDPKFKPYWPKSIRDCQNPDLLFRMDFSQETDLMSQIELQSDRLNRTLVCIQYVNRLLDRQQKETERNQLLYKFKYANSKLVLITFLILLMVVVSTLVYCFIRIRSYSMENEPDGRWISVNTAEPQQQNMSATTAHSGALDQPLAMAPSDCTFNLISEEQSDAPSDPPPAYMSRCPSTTALDPPTYDEALKVMNSQEK